MQVLTRYGCFGEYLHRIEKEATARCHHWDAGKDSAQHALEHCPVWTAPRHSLTIEIRYDLSPPAILEALLTSNDVASFCELVILRKEAAEWLRERDSYPERIGRRGRRGARGRAYTGRARATATSDGG
jgi:hypothetical protein